MTRALQLCGRGIDDLTDVEVLLRQTDDGWFADFCIGELGKLPSEVEPLMTCREYTFLQARSLVKAAQSELARVFASTPRPPEMSHE